MDLYVLDHYHVADEFEVAPASVSDIANNRGKFACVSSRAHDSDTFRCHWQ